MRILLISANREPFPEPVFPLGPVYVADALQKAGATVRIADMRGRVFGQSLRREITDFRPDRIGVSLRNVDNAAYPAVRFYLPSYASLMNSIRASSDSPIILGGSAFSLFPEEMCSSLGADSGVQGEGENAAPVFQDFDTGRVAAPGWADAPGISFPTNIGELFPGFRRYRTIGIQTSRGCPNQCIYCTYPSLEGRRRRPRSPEGVAGDIAMLHRDYGIRRFFVVDSLFNADEGHMVSVLEKIASMGPGISFSCYLQPKMSDPAIFRLLKKAGCVAVDFGTDSGSPALLSSLRKPFTVDDIRKVSRACRREALDFCHSLILGGPGETAETIRETVALMDEVSPRAAIAMTGIRIYPATEMERIAREEGLIRPGQSLLEPRFYFPSMGAQSLVKTAYESVGGRRNWFFPGRRDWSSTIGYRLLNLLYRGGPLWRTFRK